MDPGKGNYAYSILTKKGRLVKYGMIENTIQELKNGTTFNKQMKAFVKEVKDILKEYKDYQYIIIFERFIPRSLHRGNLGELVNLMIGMFLCQSKHIATIPLAAATWKNHANKNDLLLRNKTTEQHILDAIGMGLYFIAKREYLTLKQIKRIVKKINERDFYVQET